MDDVTLAYDPSGVSTPQHGMRAEELRELAPKLEAARDTTLDDARAWQEGASVPPDRQPLDAGFHYLPERLLAEAESQPDSGVLPHVERVAERMASTVGRIVLLGIGGSYMGARALFEACCHPYHNELPDPLRGGRPRIAFEGNNVDNDGVQGLLDLLRRGEAFEERGDRWGVVVVSKSGGTLETAVAFRQLVGVLQRATGGDRQQLAQLIVPVTGPSGKLFELAKAIGCSDVFEIPAGVGGRFSIFTPVGLLPAALLGLDVRQLLAGAKAMNAHFASAPAKDNLVLQYVGVCHWMEQHRNCKTRILSTWGRRLEAFGLWYDQLLSESLGKNERGALPLTVVNTRDLHSRGQQHQEGRRDKLVTNLVVAAPSREPLPIGTSDFNQDQLNELADRTLPNILQAAQQGTDQAYFDDSRPTATLTVPHLDEFNLGQLFQMFMLATVVEGRLVGTNPYGQPGVEAYKKNMNSILRGDV